VVGVSEVRIRPRNGTDPAPFQGLAGLAVLAASQGVVVSGCACGLGYSQVRPERRSRAALCFWGSVLHSHMAQGDQR